MALGLLVLALALAAVARAGGWAVVALEELPGGVVVDQPFNLRFTVRQHGNHLMSGLSPVVTLRQTGTGERVAAQAAETANEGVYEATVRLPAEGNVVLVDRGLHRQLCHATLTVAAAPAQAPMGPAPSTSSFQVLGAVALVAAAGLGAAWLRQRRRLWLAGVAVALLISLVAFGWPRPPARGLAAGAGADLTPVQMGEALFVAKGCISCHQNDKVTLVPKRAGGIGPNLTGYTASPEFLRLWLADPPGLKPNTLMPDLDLSETEIEALIAFLEDPAR
jgi:mono/diheme cytochrome c family protein